MPKRWTMQVFSAEFIGAAENKRSYPKGGRAEIAFAGRSNVGKSSMINTLLGRRTLVRTSKTPGHTQKLNFFLINDRFVFVDLPGYGYAKAPEAVRKKWRPMVEEYLRNRVELAGVVVIIDVRHGPTDLDRQLIAYLAAHRIPTIIAATKVDKLSRSGITARLSLIEEGLGNSLSIVLFSAATGEGKKELWKEIKSLIE
ncbi:MAG: ribosome biogenesis GTP-binding protein YihA/YsxC [Desulfomonile sp.]|nr:ribosome biogenesis GTP-binding protein YihA/YsxC [Desulfomonile sp.]